MQSQTTKKSRNLNENVKVSEVRWMILTPVKPNNKQFKGITQSYIHEGSSKTNISELVFEFVGKKISFTDIRTCFEQIPYKQKVALYYWNTTSIRKSLPIFLTEQTIVDTIQRLERLDRAGTDINISYINQAAIETLLGEDGKKVLQKTIELICNTARKFKWPLYKIELQCTSDIEIKNWSYILLVLYFESDFDTADEYLNLLYVELDNLATTLTDKEQDILQRLVYFDVETIAIVSSS